MPFFSFLCDSNKKNKKKQFVKKLFFLLFTFFSLSPERHAPAPESGLLELALRSAATARRATSALLFASSYARVMFSTGPMFLTLVALRWDRRERELWVLPAKLYGKYREDVNKKNSKKKTKTKKMRGSAGLGAADDAVEEERAAGCEADGDDGERDAEQKKSKRLHGAGAACGALFTHLHGSSWHSKDAEIVSWVGRKRRGESGSGSGSGSGGGGAGASSTTATTPTTLAAAAFFVSAVVVAVRKTRQSQQQQQQQLLQLQQQQQQERRHLSSKHHLQRPFGFIGCKAKRTKKSTTPTPTPTPTELGQKQI